MALLIVSACREPGPREVAPVETPTVSQPDGGRAEEDPAIRGVLSSRPTVFARCVERGGWECVLETAVATYVDESGREVALVAAEHTADPEHYRVVQARLAKYELVLYEGWKSSGDELTDNPPADIPGLEWLMGYSALSVEFVTTALGFRHVYQWSGAVDYTPETFLNADMSYARFAALAHERSELVTQLRAAYDLLPTYLVSVCIRMVPKSGDGFRRLLSLPRAWHQACRYVYAQESCHMGNLLGAYNALSEIPRNVTIHERNALVERFLLLGLARGMDRVAVYYGAVHIPELEGRLLQHGFKRRLLEWVPCWDVRRLE